MPGVPALVRGESRRTRLPQLPRTVRTLNLDIVSTTLASYLVVTSTSAAESGFMRIFRYFSEYVDPDVESRWRRRREFFSQVLGQQGWGQCLCTGPSD